MCPLAQTVNLICFLHIFLFLVIFVTSSIKGEKPVWANDDNFYDVRCVRENTFLAPGSIWKRNDVDYQSLWKLTNASLGIKQYYIPRTEMELLLANCPNCQYELFVCVNDGDIHCPDLTTIRSCGFIQFTNNKCVDSLMGINNPHTIEAELSTDNIWLYVYHVNQPISVLDMRGQYMYHQNRERIYGDDRLTFGFDRLGSQTRFLLGYQMVSSPTRPDHSLWLPSDCFQDERTIAPSKGTGIPTVAPTSFPEISTGKVISTTMAYKMQTAATTSTNTAIIIGSVAGAILVIVLIIVAIVVIRRSKVDKSEESGNFKQNLSNFKQKYFSRKETSEREHNIYEEPKENEETEEDPRYSKSIEKLGKTNTKYITPEDINPYDNSQENPTVLESKRVNSPLKIENNIDDIIDTLYSNPHLTESDIQRLSRDEDENGEKENGANNTVEEEDVPQEMYATVNKDLKKKKYPGNFTVENDQYDSFDKLDRPQSPEKKTPGAWSYLGGSNPFLNKK